MDKETDLTIERYREKLTEMGVTPDKIIVFGSYARGDVGEESDLDLLVIASQFEGMDLWERMVLLGRARVGISKPMEMLGITPAEAESADLDSFIKHEALEKGILVA